MLVTKSLEPICLSGQLSGSQARLWHLLSSAQFFVAGLPLGWSSPHAGAVDKDVVQNMFPDRGVQAAPPG